MAHLTIIGTGTMGQAIADLARKGGSTVELHGADGHGTRLAGDIVVLAVPYAAVDDVLARPRELEALGFLQIGLAATEKITWTGGFGLVT